MKKVVQEEQANIGSYDLKRYILRGLTVLILSATLLTSCAYPGKSSETPGTVKVATSAQGEGKQDGIIIGRPKRDHSLENPFDDLEVSSNIESTEVGKLEQDLNDPFDGYLVHYVADDPDLWPYSDTMEIEIDGLVLELAHPEKKEVEGKTIYVAPQGFMVKGDICYRITSSYASQEEIAEMTSQYRVPEEHPEYILVGSKAVEVIHAEKETIGELNYDLLPAGYERLNDLGYVIHEAEPVIVNTK